MNKLEYLKAAMANKLFQKKAWIISAFAMTAEGETAYLENPYPYRIVRKMTGIYFLNKKAELERIEGANPSEPLFKFFDPVTVTPQMCVNVKTPVETYIGNWLFNEILLVNAFGNKFSFVDDVIDLGVIADKIAPILRDTPKPGEERSPEYIYCDEYCRFVDSIPFVEGLSQLCVIAATPKNITPAPGITEFKQTLLTKYGDTLSNPVELAKFEKELKDYDEKYLEDDPSNGKFLSGKVKNVARKKLFLTVGAEGSFEETQKVHPIINSLSEGFSIKPDDFVAGMNGIRSGSYSRGFETQKGGVSAKVLLRSVGNFKIDDTDCETTLGRRMYFNTDDIDQLVGREILQESGWSPVKTLEQAKTLIGKSLVVRSPMYCQLDGDHICKHCAGERLAENPVGLTIAVTEISSIIMTAALKKMHGTVLSVAKMNYLTALT
jgi:hypothetical protein